MQASAAGQKSAASAALVALDNGAFLTPLACSCCGVGARPRQSWSGRPQSTQSRQVGCGRRQSANRCHCQRLVRGAASKTWTSARRKVSLNSGSVKRCTGNATASSRSESCSMLLRRRRADTRDTRSRSHDASEKIQSSRRTA